MRDFIDFAKNRYSVRKYKNTPVEEEKIALILEAAKIAPTACNNQPQKIYVVKSPEMREKLAKISPCTFGAPVIFVIGYDVDRSAKGLIFPEHDFGDTDDAIVCTHMMLEARDLGLGTCWVGYFEEKKVAEALGIPGNIRLRSLLPTGYPAEDSVPGPKHTQYRTMEDMVEER